MIRKLLGILLAIVIVLSLSANAAYRLDESWGGYGRELGQWIQPTDVAITSAGLIYTADRTNHRIQVIDPSRAADPYSAIGVGELRFPIGVAPDSSGNIYVVESRTRKIVKIDSTGTTTDWTVTGNPVAIAVDAAGNVYTVDTSDYIKKYNSSGTLVEERRVGSVGGAYSPSLTAIAVGPSGNVYITENTRDYVEVYSGNLSSRLDRWGGDGRFVAPMGIAVDSAENVYVVDQNLGVFKKFTSAGGTLDTAGAGSLSSPQGIGVDSSGNNVYITESPATVSRISRWEIEGAGAPPPPAMRKTIKKKTPVYPYSPKKKFRYKR